MHRGRFAVGPLSEFHLYEWRTKGSILVRRLDLVKKVEILIHQPQSQMIWQAFHVLGKRSSKHQFEETLIFLSPALFGSLLQLPLSQT